MKLIIDPIERKVYFGFAIAVAVMAGLAALTYLKTSEILARSREVYRIHHVLVKLDRVFKLEASARTHQKAYVATGRTKELDQCQDALFEIDRTVSEIRQLSAQQPEQLLQLNALEPLVVQQIQLLVTAIRWRQRTGSAEAVRHFDAPAADRAFHGIEDLLGQFRQRENELMEAQDKNLERRSGEIIALMAFGLFICGLIFIFIHRQNHREMLRRKAVGEHLRQSAIHDPLTQVYNRLHLDEAFRELLSGAQRQQQPLGVVMLDIDHFKRFNDQHGHAAGDLVLAEVAHAVSASLRPQDLIFRYGGEEFTLLLPGADTADAQQAAERARQAVADLKLSYRGEDLGKLAISLGVSSFPGTAEDAGELMSQADKALYEAKRSGRNRCVVWGPRLRSAA